MIQMSTLPVALSFEDLIRVQMTVLKIVVAYFHAVVVLSFAVVMELDTAFFEKLEIEPLAQPLGGRKKKIIQKNVFHISHNI